MTVVVSTVAAALLAIGIGSALPADGRAWRAIGCRMRAAIDWLTAGARRRRWGAAVLAALGAVVALAGAPRVGVVLIGGPLVASALRRRRHERRRRALGRGAPAVARAVADGLDAGFGVRRAITDAARGARIAWPAGDELGSVAARLDVGDPLPAALDGWRRRTGDPAHATLVAALLLHGEAGGELAEVLREQAAALDRARRQAAEAESAIVQARAAARIVGGIPLLAAAGVVVLAPGTARQMTGSAVGAVLVALAIGLQVAAAAAVRRLAAEPR